MLIQSQTLEKNKWIFFFIFFPLNSTGSDGCDQGGNTFQAVSAEFESDPSATSSVILVLGIVSVVSDIDGFVNN